jgi:B12-binding domain/radical SAM domain protein
LLRRLEATRPNLVLIGSMSICLPGAVACARLVKECLGDDVCVVLGGRHPSESFARLRGNVWHHASSPLRLMAEGAVGPYFDVVVSGDGEYVVAALGELIARLARRGRKPAEARRHLGELITAPGRWIAGALVDGKIITADGRGGPIDYADLPVPCELFGVSTAFDVFGGRPTAHVFSDVGRGCIYDCQFCSERRSVVGPPAQLETSADRLYRQLAAAARVIAEDHPGLGASAFVEDSTLLAHSGPLWDRLAGRLESSPLDLRFGGQLTIDQILTRPERLARLRDVGLDYLFVGLETLSPAEVGGINKDIRRRSGSWVDRADAAFERLADLGMTCGAAVLFGLGERHASRLALIEQVDAWRDRYGFPEPISMNWAVQHPLLGHDGGTGYTYTRWSVPRGPFIDAFRDFGEASVVYPLAGQPAPVLAEVCEVCDAVAALPAPRERDHRPSQSCRSHGGEPTLFQECWQHFRGARP